MELRLVTFNLQGVANGWFDHRSEAAISGLRRLAPDVLCLQEATLVPRRGGLYDQPTEISEGLGLEYVAFAAHGWPERRSTWRQDGLVVMSRWPFRQVSHVRLPTAPSDPPDGRVALRCRIAHPEADVDIVNVHLAWRPEEEATRLLQAEHILDLFVLRGLGRAGHHGVLAGDINAIETEPVVRRMCRSLRDAWREFHPDSPGYTWLRANPYTEGWDMPDRRLDYVFVPPGVELRDVHLALDRPEPVWPSDHCALVVDLRWD